MSIDCKTLIFGDLGLTGTESFGSLRKEGTLDMGFLPVDGYSFLAGYEYVGLYKLFFNVGRFI